MCTQCIHMRTHIHMHVYVYIRTNVNMFARVLVAKDMCARMQEYIYTALNLSLLRLTDPLTST